jgi:hypothetical protein
MALLFWISVAGVAYVFVGYPALLLVWARLRPRPVYCGLRIADCGSIADGGMRNADSVIKANQQSIQQ